MKKRNIGVLFGACILFALVSGAVTFFVFFQPQSVDEEVAEQLTDQVTKTDKKEKQDIGMQEILDGADEVYLESYLGSSDIVEMSEKDAGAIVARLKSLDLKFVMESVETTQDIEENQDCLYAVHIKNKNIKIKINEKYVSIHTVKGGTQVFETDAEQLKALNKELESIYMNQYNNCEIFENPQILWIEAKDENKQWILNERAMEKLLPNIYLLSPVDGNEMIGVSSRYPDYDINIETDSKNYKVHLINKEVLLLDSSDSYAYYRYDSKLWDYINKKYAVAFNASPNEFKYLLKASEITVDDMENVFDFEDDTYYNMEVPRWLMKAKKEEKKEIPVTEQLMYNMNFTVGGDTIEVKIYENHIEYNGKIYYSEKIGESIRSALSV